MGVDTRKPPLPAPTESSYLQTSGEDVNGTDLATDISRRTDRTSYSIPEDGSPVTISTSKRRDHKHKDHEKGLTRASHQSQTSLLIEYFEGGKGPNVHTRPSVRVKVTPSSARRSKDTKDHIQITEAGGHRKPSYTRRISLGPNGTSERIIESDEKSTSSYTSAAENSSLAGRPPPVEIEVMHRDQGSDLSGANVPRDLSYVTHNASDISSMPPDSMLEGNPVNLTPQRTRSRSISRDQTVGLTDTLKTPSRRRSRSLSRERITQKVIEKLGNKPRHVSGGKHAHEIKSRSRSVSKEQLVEKVQSPKRRSSRHQRTEELPSGTESSLLTSSQISDKRKSGDQYSFRSGTSKSSYNNPKLLETVEDAIRRLILPEFDAIRHDQKSQQSSSKFDRGHRDSFASGSSISREDLTRKLSKHASAPDVSQKPKVVLNRDENNPGTILSGNSMKGRKESRRDRDYDSPSERSYQREVSEETVIRDDKEPRKRSKEGHALRNAAAGALAGGILTHAALRHHDSKSSVDRRERRKKRSKSHSRSASLAESTEEIFSRHDVPPMPMRSEINGSDLTRESILSERTSTPTSERRRNEIREVARGSPKEVFSPTSVTPTRSPGALQRGLGTHHSNLSKDDISVHSPQSTRSFGDTHRSHVGGAALAGVAGAGALAATHSYENHDRNDEHQSYHHGRGLSPIQSVASYQEESEPPNRDSFRPTHSSDSLSSTGRHLRKNSTLSIKSLSSAASAEFVPSRRPQGINLENGKDVLEQHDLGKFEGQHSGIYSKDPVIDEWYDRQHEQNDRYRNSLDDGSLRDSTVEVNRMTNYTDDSMDAPYLDKVTAARQIRGAGANPEYIHTPLAVESAVASLLDQSALDVHSTLSGQSKVGERPYLDSLHNDQQDDTGYLENSRRNEIGAISHGSPLKQLYESDTRDAHSLSERSYEENLRRHDKARSRDKEEEHVPMGISGLPIADDPLPEIGQFHDSESDINTNPSIIQGPMGGIPHDNRDHWPNLPTPPQSKGDLLQRSNNSSAHESLRAAAANMLSAAAGAGAGAAFVNRERGTQESYEKDQIRDINDHQPTIEDEYEYERDLNHDFGPIKDTYMSGHMVPTPPGAKDEGYISAANPRSAGGLTPDSRAKGINILDSGMVQDDPFMGRSHVRQLSGNSHGMPSPLYDSATGRGIDRIQSKDVVALMDHLTVRDAQRNARDTEILVTLVRSAAEMRNSFEDLKRFIAEQDDMIIDTGGKQHDRTIQKIIGGPRPQPVGTPRVPRRASEDDLEDLPTKRRNVFRRALRGLGGRNSNDLGRIEDMLVQLLDNVEGLKAGQDVRPRVDLSRGNSYNSDENGRGVAQDGYEPEGQAGTSSTGNQSGSLSIPPSRQSNRVRGYDGRRGSQNRVSTVLEGDEELEAHEQDLLNTQFEQNEQLLTPTRELPRGGSVPLETPPMVAIPEGTQSNEHTPRTATDKSQSRKHKSSSSSFFPKISRWSKTTASSGNDNVRSSGRREQPLSEPSRSGSEINYNSNEHYDPHGDDRLRSNTSLEEDRPPSPLIPSQVSEKPAYQAHRDSLNLQHPQPRQGPTGRYQNHLESQAQTFGSPLSPASDQWGSNPILSRFTAGAGNRHSGGAGNLSPISDAGYSEISERSNAPARPPKIRDDGPLIPTRPPKIAVGDGKGTFAERSAVGGEEQRYGDNTLGYEKANNSPRTSQTPQRKPTGPRPISTSGSYSPDKSLGSMNQIKQNRYRGSPNHIESSTEDVTF